MAKQTTLEDLRDFITGHADDETHARVSSALNDPDSDLSVFIAGLRGDSKALLVQALKRKSGKFEEIQE